MKKIKITEEDIKNGIQHDAFHCAIALALKREFPDSGVAVLEGFALAGGKKWQLDEKAKLFMNDFDNGKEVHPIEFELIDEPFVFITVWRKEDIVEEY